MNTAHPDRHHPVPRVADERRALRVECVVPFGVVADASHGLARILDPDVATLVAGWAQFETEPAA
jgi:hypothetical protein